MPHDPLRQQFAFAALRRTVRPGASGGAGCERSAKPTAFVELAFLGLFRLPAPVFLLEFPIIDTAHQALRCDSNLLGLISESSTLAGSDTFGETIG